MHGDFSRLTFDYAVKRYSAVYSQQGRVQLDSDANEQLRIDLDTARRLTIALIGPHAGPRDRFGFQIGFQIDVSDHLPDLTIGGGDYYVDGVRADADRPAPGTAVVDTQLKPGTGPATWSYYDQPDAFRDPENADDRLPDFPFVAYLKMYERLVTAVEDPAMREVALGAAMPDTAARSKVSWQVLAVTAAEVGIDGQTTDPKALREKFQTWADQQAAAGATLAARAKVPARVENDPCLASPDAAYRGRENQLYRVEIHDGGRIPDSTAGSGVAMRSALSAPTFVWSRENGSVVFGITGLADRWVTLDSLGRDDKLALDVGDWVEVVDDSYLAHGRPLPLLQIDEIDIPGRRVFLSGTPAGNVGTDLTRHPYLRRWDQTAPTGRGAPKQIGGAIEIKEGVWLDLENGVQVFFPPGGAYRTGDYWTVPARIATGDVVWPTDATGSPLLAAPDGPAWHYAPLAFLTGREQGQNVDLRSVFSPTAFGAEALG
jgi:hypothetical protein